MRAYDLLVIGGGVNGAGIARDAAGRGISVLLCEQDDLAQHTSSASTKLIHGGLRYLENYDFALVRHALHEREVLLRAAPHIIWPLRFVLPHHRALRPQWMIRIGLFLYDHIGGRKLLPGSQRIDLRRHPAGAYLKPEYTTGFEYSDCWVQDARLVVLNAMDAQARGADILTRTRCTGLRRGASHWVAELRDESSGACDQVQVRALVNAAGPWVEQVLNLDAGRRSTKRLRLVKGSHIVVPRLFDHDYPYIFQNADGRVLFAIPFEQDFTLLGTTDQEVRELPARAQISDWEIAYICRAVGEYFKQPIRPEDALWSYSGIRPLYDDAAISASKVTRDYKLDLDTSAAPILSVFGGKITTYRVLAEQALHLLAGILDIRHPGWTADCPLPGGDIDNNDFDVFLTGCRTRYPWLPKHLLYDYARNYGTRISQLLAGCHDIQALGHHFDGPLYEREVAYLMAHEFAHTAEDVLWRRSKKGLRVAAEVVPVLDEWMAARHNGH
ncbi:MAG: glycerol-3-phosphate dehydrogenase [Chromatiaceae bacterium]|nr:glycerol-3-phosphate dehydrogenase [Chromatiaceae bacterium]